MLLALAVTLLTATDQSSPVVVLVASKRAGAEAYAAKVAAKVHSTLLANSTIPAQDDAAGSKLLKKAGGDARACQGATDCLLKAAQQLGPRAIVIGVDVGKVAKTLAVHLEAVSADSTEALAVSDFSAPADAWADPSAAPITAFVKQVIEKSATPAIPDQATAKSDDIKRPADAPQEASLTPPPPTPDPSPAATATRSSASSGKLLPVLALGVAAAALIASGVMLGLGLNEKGIVDRSLSAGGMNTELSKAEFDARRSRGNLYFTLSLSTALLGVVLGATGGTLLVL